MKDLTKRCIADAAKELMKTKELDKIRVTEICKAAEVGRPAFYYHFKDKYDLVAWTFFQSAYKTDIISKGSAAESLKQMKKDFIFYKRAYADNSQNALWQYMLEYLVDKYSALAKKILGTKMLDTQTRYSIRMYCYGGIGMTREWVLGDDITSAETVVELMFNSMPDNLQKIYFGE